MLSLLASLLVPALLLLGLTLVLDGLARALGLALHVAVAPVVAGLVLVVLGLVAVALAPLLGLVLGVVVWLFWLGVRPPLAPPAR